MASTGLTLRFMPRCTPAAQEEARIRRLYDKHDTDKSGGLHDMQLKKFMQEYVQLLVGHESKVVADDEVKYVMKIADSYGDGEVASADIVEAVAVRHRCARNICRPCPPHRSPGIPLRNIARRVTDAGLLCAAVIGVRADVAGLTGRPGHHRVAVRGLR